MLSGHRIWITLSFLFLIFKKGIITISLILFSSRQSRGDVYARMPRGKEPRGKAQAEVSVLFQAQGSGKASLKSFPFPLSRQVTQFSAEVVI